MADLLKLHNTTFLPPCVFLIDHVVYVHPVFVQSCFSSRSNILGITGLARYLVHLDKQLKKTSANIGSHLDQKDKDTNEQRLRQLRATPRVR